MFSWRHNSTIWCHNSSSMATINRKWTWLTVLLLSPSGYSIWDTENWLRWVRVTYMPREGIRGGSLPYLKVVWNSVWLTPPPIFDIVRSHWVPILCPSFDLLSAEKICFSLSHLVLEIIAPKLVIAKIYHLTVLRHFIPVFSFISESGDPFFHCSWFFFTLHFYKP